MDDLQFDRFGGWRGKRFEPTGFFRVEKDERWWLVSPLGNAFLSFGINHLHAEWWRQSYNRSAWQMRLELEDLNGDEFAPALRNWFLRTCGEYGFNSAGFHTDLPVINLPTPSIAYIQPIDFVDIPHWKPDIPDSNFVDVFADAFKAHCDRMARRLAAPRRDDPWLLGYAMTDCPLFTEEDCRERPDVIGGAERASRIGWPRRLRNLPAGSPGKKAYVRTVHDIYQGQIDRFNKTYRTRFASFDALEAAERWRLQTDLSNADETRDNVEFLKKTVGTYYQTARDAIFRYDPNHLFLGDKLNANTDTIDTLLPVTNQFTDIVFYQMYGRYDVQKPGLDRWSRIAGKPVINGDSGYTMVTEKLPRPYGPVADGLKERAGWTAEFFNNAFARSDFVGWHYCGLIDAPNMIPNKKDRQHSGVMNGCGEPYPELRTTLKACADKLYETANGVV